MRTSYLNIQAGQHGAQTHVALLKVGNSGHDLLKGCPVAGFSQLLGQLSQLVGVGGVVIDHVLHQRSQLFHGGVLLVAVALALVVVIVAVTAAFVTVVMVMAMTLAFVTVVMGAVFTMQMVMGVGMLMIVAMLMSVFMGVGHTVVGVLMGMGMLMVMVVMAAGNMIVMNMHSNFSFAFFYIIYSRLDNVKTFILPG